jgi:ADP-ribose pyrophosphatase
MSETLADEAAPQTVVSSTVVFSGHVWDIRQDVFEYGPEISAHAGEDSAPASGRELITREYVDHPGAVAILALDNEGRVLLIQQYRHPIAMREWELPAGLLDIENEDPLEAAKRELAEEVDLQASDWTKLVTFHTSPGGSNEVLEVFLARGLSSLPAFDREQEEADIVQHWALLDDVVAGVLESRLQNSILMIAVLAAHARG